ncbi:MAG: hypothetical protein M0T70_05710, partial [Geobacteraceae bacterium]|nr:hypothetical protein [Geobacteraceae bacterium]
SGNTCSEFFGIMSHNLPLSDAPRLTQNFGREATTILTQGESAARPNPAGQLHARSHFLIKIIA